MIDYNFLREIRINELRRDDLSSNLRFSEIIQYIDRLINEFSYFENKENQLLENDLQLVERIFSDFQSVINRIINFQTEPTESVQDAQGRRNKIVQNIKNIDISFTSSVLPITLRLKNLENEKNISNKVEDLNKVISDSETLLNTKVSSFESIFDSNIRNFSNEAKSFNDDLKKKINEANQLINESVRLKEEAENFSVENLVEKYGDIFSRQAKNNIRVAYISLALFVSSLITIIVFAYVFFNPILDNLLNLGNDNQIRLEYIITNVVFRLTLLGLGLIFVKEALKNFNINMRLFNVNKHRQNSLESFSVLVSNVKGFGNENNEIRNFIIKEIAQTIYSNQDDGYLNRDKKNISVSEISDLIKAFKS